VDALSTRIASFDKQAIAETKRLVDLNSLPPDAEIAPAVGRVPFFRAAQLGIGRHRTPRHLCRPSGLRSHPNEVDRSELKVAGKDSAGRPLTAQLHAQATKTDLPKLIWMKRRIESLLQGGKTKEAIALAEKG